MADAKDVKTQKEEPSTPAKPADGVAVKVTPVASTAAAAAAAVADSKEAVIAGSSTLQRLFSLAGQLSPDILPPLLEQICT